MIFYPGKSSFIPSVRSLQWKNGLEDYGLLAMYQKVADSIEGCESILENNSKLVIALRIRINDLLNELKHTDRRMQQASAELIRSMYSARSDILEFLSLQKECRS